MNDNKFYLGDKVFNYQMLDRLKQDCEYFLGAGNRQEKSLHQGSIEKHIEYMKALYNSFEKDEKPEWCNMQDIKNYKLKMEVDSKKLYRQNNLNFQKDILVLDVAMDIDNPVALLKKNNEYIIASGFKITDKENNIIEWNQGHYRDNLFSATAVFQNMVLNKQTRIENMMKAFRDTENFVLVASILQFETNREKEKITDFDYQKLEYIYDRYVSNEETSLISENIKDIEEENSFESIEEEVIDYLKDEGVDVNKVENEEIAGIVQDVFDESIIRNESIGSLIWGEDYLEGKVEELLNCDSYKENDDEEDQEQ